MIETFAPDAYLQTFPLVFLAGTIEMGEAADWRAVVKQDLSDHRVNVHLLNPKRTAWDSSWEQSINNPEFNGQVTWELQGIESADLVVFYFDPLTKSPISLLELGLVAGLGCNTLVCCPTGFWRKGNVDVVCKRYGIPQCESISQLTSAIEEFVGEF